MSRSTAVIFLFVAAMLEAGGDALVRSGLHNSSVASRTALFLLGGIFLFAYGYLVNRPAWDFGRLLGIYVVLFFLVAQGISWVVFGQRPTIPVVCAGALMIAGGLIMTVF